MQAAMNVLALAVVAAVNAGCAQKPSAPAVVIENKTYNVVPAQVLVKAGIVSGEISELKVMERIEQGSGRVDTPAKLSANLKLTNSSTDQTVRMLGGKLIYIDDQGQILKIEQARTEPSLKFTPSFNNGTDRLDPGQEATQAVEVDFPAEALKAGKLKEIRLELSYIPSAYKLQTANFSVSVTAAPAAAAATK